MNRTTLIAIALATLAGSAMAETYPGAVPMTPSSLTRQEVMAQTQAAIQAGDIVAAGELGASVRAQGPAQGQAAGRAVNAIRAEARQMGAAMQRHEFVAASHDTTHLY